VNIPVKYKVVAGFLATAFISLALMLFISSFFFEQAATDDFIV